MGGERIIILEGLSVKVERRLYKREYINIESEFIHKEAKNPETRELFGYIYDISEGGIKIIISDETSKNIAKAMLPGDTVYFQEVDSYELEFKKKI